MSTTGTTPNDRPSTLIRWKLGEPVRLYLYGLGSVLIVGLVLAGALSGEWTEYGLWALGTVLGLAGGTEAARASVYSTNGMVTRMMENRATWDAARTGADTLQLGAPRRGQW